jgi:hypothetical protein
MWVKADIDRVAVRYFMSTRLNPKKPAKLRSWRVIIMRSRGEYLGSIEAPDRQTAEAAAIKLFDLDQDQRSRLLIRERV